LRRRRKASGAAGIRALELFDLPYELSGGVSKLTVTGTGDVYVERHRGLIEYADGMVAISTGGGTVRFFGSGMSLTALSGDEMRINGQLERIEFK
jgi:sporulation protein YqfC